MKDKSKNEWYGLLVSCT